MNILATIYLWLLIGDFIVALGRWGYEERNWRDVVFWPTRLWFTIAHIVHDRRTDLYRRVKHY